MKNRIRNNTLLLLTGVLVLIFASCNNQMNTSLLDSDSGVLSESADTAYTAEPTDTAGPADVYFDSARGMAVFVDETGVEILIQAEEATGIVVCSEIIDFISLPSPTATLRKLGVEGNHVKAFVLGKRSDGHSGLWVVYGSGRVAPVINSDDLETTSELLEMVEGRQPLSGYFSWSYTALDMISNEAGTEIIIIGYAENSGVERHNYTIEAGTTIGVYWAVTLDEDGYYHISRAKVIGYKDASNWKNYFWKNKKSDFRRQHRWMWTLRMFFAGWYDRYLVMSESVELGENAGEYNIYGTDLEDEDSVAVVTAKKVLSIEKYEVEYNNPPVASFYDFDYLVSGAGDENANGEYVDSGLYNYFSSYTNGSCYIHWDGSDYWGIDTTQNDDGYSTKLYYHVNFADIVPETDNDGPWTVGDGTTPVPSVIAVSPVSGDTGAGNIMRGNYRYTDDEGDPEGVSIYKWYRCTGLSDSGTEILGETEQTYTTIPGTDNYIRFEVTPVDDIGNVGVPLRSDAVPIS